MGRSKEMDVSGYLDKGFSIETARQIIADVENALRNERQKALEDPENLYAYSEEFASTMENLCLVWADAQCQLAYASYRTR